MERFTSQQGEWGGILIINTERREPVCLVHNEYYPHAADIILAALNQKYPEEDNKYVE